MDIVIDTNILILDPTILAKRKDNVNFIVPRGVLDEITAASGRRRDFRILRELILKAKESDDISIDDSGIPPNIPASRLSGTDVQVIGTALNILQNNPEVVIATQDIDIHRAASSVGIKAIKIDELQLLLHGSTISDQQNADKAHEAIKIQKNQLILGFVGGVICTIAIYLIWSNFDFIVATFKKWGTFSLLLIFGLFLYWARARWRLTYSITEILVGFLIAFYVFYPDYNYNKLETVDFLQIFAGLYLMVSGQQNCGKALQDTRLQQVWNRFSGEQK